MNFEMIKKSIGTTVRLRPVPITRTRVQAGEEFDADWKIQAVHERPFRAVQLYCADSMHVVRLGIDNVQDFRTSGHLMLKCQMIIKGNEAKCEPLPDTRSIVR